MTKSIEAPAAIGDGYDLADTSRRMRAILVGSAGNLIEWFDIYAYTAFAIYFAAAFFPAGDAVAQQLNAAALFAISFLMRPIGSLIFCYMADRHGRRMSLTLSVLLMCLGSLLIAVCPTYASIGVWASVLLIIARLVQGLSLGGEYGASTTYLAEMAHPNRRGFYSGVWYTTLVGGQFAAVLLLFALQKLFLTPDQLKAWGWRIPFVVGAALSVFAYVMRRDLPETVLFTQARQVNRDSPWVVLARNWKPAFLVVGLTVGGTSAFYTYTTYMQKFLKLSVGLNDDQTTLVVLGALTVAIILQPIYGAISDRVGRKAMLIGFGVAGTVGTYPLLTAMHSTKSPLTAFLLYCAAWMVVSGYTSVSAIVKAELFPTAARAMGVGIPYAITAAVFGGTVDWVALTFKQNAWEEGFYLYASALIFISLLCYLQLPNAKASRMEQAA